jgi:hypothetical protein
MLEVRDASVRARMRVLRDDGPAISNAAFAGKLVWYAGVAALAQPIVYGMAAATSDLLHLDHHLWIGKLTRGFSGDDLLRAVRRRPSAAQMALLRRRLATAHARLCAARREVAERVVEALPPSLEVLGGAARPHAWWLLPVASRTPDLLVARLRAVGFDATRGGGVLAVVDRPDARCPDPIRVRRAVARAVYVPVAAGLSVADVDRLIVALRDSAPPVADLHAPCATPEVR